jgi:hypothetical protein
MGQRRSRSTEGQRQRLVEELAEIGLCLDGSKPWHALVVEELDYALRPAVHERRIPSFGAFIAPSVSSWAWEESTALAIERRPIGDRPTDSARRFADGVSSWLIRHLDGRDEWAVFDRPAGSERDLVVLAEAFGACVVQRHPSGAVRLAGDFGVYRWDGMHWHHEPRIYSWIDSIPVREGDDRVVLAKILAFAVHDLGARNVGATLIYRPGERAAAFYQQRLPVPPPLHIRRPADLAPLRHVLGQVDGAAMFDAHGVLTEIGVRLVPSMRAEADVEGFKGMRHTSARRYSSDDPQATVIVVSEDGPVTVLRDGHKLGSSAPVLVDPDDLIDPDPAELDDDAVDDTDEALAETAP